MIEKVEPVVLSLADIRRKYEDAFKAFFGVPLSQYWDDQLGGFQSTPFMTQVFHDLPHHQVHYDLLAVMYYDIADYWRDYEKHASR